VRENLDRSPRSAVGKESSDDIFDVLRCDDASIDIRPPEVAVLLAILDDSPEVPSNGHAAQEQLARGLGEFRMAEARLEPCCGLITLQFPRYPRARGSILRLGICAEPRQYLF